MICTHGFRPVRREKKAVCLTLSCDIIESSRSDANSTYFGNEHDIIHISSSFCPWFTEHGRP